ncbi:2-keto-4-pentenoate hydratase [Paracidovorax wautersii]|uniref:2-keto-4-pentenoate hydratase n=1 Tax=Paracidovorax wautersii TaxID=1177982 RepID=A0A1I2H422_9BURK|nr:fumarylacetoacetate hydrolase family protein [Paracidovorax wautersii]SFF24120.1 2-keto-4-pentenoate hydratase [Paracidovorax wautersii]
MPADFDPRPAADCLIRARTGVVPRPSDLPAALRPADAAQAYAVQDRVALARGAIAGWKVGAASPEAEPSRAALACDSVHVAGADGVARLRAQDFLVIGVEAELVFQCIADLPPRGEPYSPGEVLDALGSVHAAIEVCDTRFATWGGQDPLSRLADQACHGALVVGTGRPDGAAVDVLRQPVRLEVNGGTVVAHDAGGNPAGEPLRLLVWLANFGAHSLGGLRAGQWITTGSWTGTPMAMRGDRVVADFPGIGRAELRID